VEFVGNGPQRQNQSVSSTTQFRVLLSDFFVANSQLSVFQDFDFELVFELLLDFFQIRGWIPGFGVWEWSGMTASLGFPRVVDLGVGVLG
jgi:hypothetical protein